MYTASKTIRDTYFTETCQACHDEDDKGKKCKCNDRDDVCPDCDGDGLHECDECNGKGCKSCNDKGHYDCEACDGTGVKKKGKK